jgi:hypothetical protein
VPQVLAGVRRDGLGGDRHRLAQSALAAGVM